MSKEPRLPQPGIRIGKIAADNSGGSINIMTNPPMDSGCSDQFKTFRMDIKFNKKPTGYDLSSLFDDELPEFKKIRAMIRKRKREVDTRALVLKFLHGVMAADWDWEVMYVRFFGTLKVAKLGQQVSNSFLNPKDVILNDIPEEGTMIILVGEEAARQAMYFNVEALKTRFSAIAAQPQVLKPVRLSR